MTPEEFNALDAQPYTLVRLAREHRLQVKVTTREYRLTSAGEHIGWIVVGQNQMIEVHGDDRLDEAWPPMFPVSSIVKVEAV